MRFSLLAPVVGGLLVLAAGNTLAQQPNMVPITTKTVDANGDTVEMTRYVPARNPLRTPEDSARERLRQANAKRLRQEAAQGVAPAKELHMEGVAAPTAPPPPPPPAPETKPDPKALERAARSREKAAREAEEADRKRQKTLEKRTRDD